MELSSSPVARDIQAIIDAIKAEGTLSAGLIQTKASAMRDYDKNIATRSVRHKADGMAITLIKDQAKGDASECLYAKIVAEETLKAHWERLKYLQAQLNGYQSIYKHLDST